MAVGTHKGTTLNVLWKWRSVTADIIPGGMLRVKEYIWNLSGTSLLPLAAIASANSR